MDRPPWNRSLALGAWTALGLCSAVVASRRAAGAYAGPLPPAALLSAVALAAAASLGALWLLRTGRPRPTVTSPSDSVWRRWAPEVTAWLLPTTFALVIAAGAAPRVYGVLVGVSALGGFLLCLAQFDPAQWRMFAGDAPAESVTKPLGRALPASSLSAGSEPPTAAVPDLAVLEADDAAATQWMVRRTDAAGESIEGAVRVEFAVGQRDAVVHVTFCPPLPATPVVELEDVDGADWQLKAAAVFPYGLRLQVQRGRDVSQPASGRVAYLATAARQTHAA